MIIAWTFFIVILLLTVIISYDVFVEYRRGNTEEGAKGFLFVLFMVVVASIPAQYIFGG